jgi:hypothetical protein
MDRRKFLLGAVCSLFLVGFVGALTPFVSSMSPNAKANAALERIDISKIHPGKLILTESYSGYENRYNGYNWSLLIYKKYNGQLNVWNIPTKGKVVGMPDIRWYRPYFECNQFGPTFVNGKVDESKPIKCHNSNQPDGWFMKLEWDIDGNVTKGHTDNMHKAIGTIEGKYFVLGKRS